MLITAIYGEEIEGGKRTLCTDMISPAPANVTPGELIDASMIAGALTSRNLMSERTEQLSQERKDMRSYAEQVMDIAEKKGWIKRQSATQWEWTREGEEIVKRAILRNEFLNNRIDRSDTQRRIETHVRNRRWPNIEGLNVKITESKERRTAEVSWKNGPTPAQMAIIMETYVAPLCCRAPETDRPVTSYTLKREVDDPEFLRKQEDIKKRFGEKVEQRYRDTVDLSAQKTGEYAWFLNRPKNKIPTTQGLKRKNNEDRKPVEGKNRCIAP